LERKLAGGRLGRMRSAAAGRREERPVEQAEPRADAPPERHALDVRAAELAAAAVALAEREESAQRAAARLEAALAEREAEVTSRELALESASRVSPVHVPPAERPGPTADELVEEAERRAEVEERERALAASAAAAAAAAERAAVQARELREAEERLAARESEL